MKKAPLKWAALAALVGLAGNASAQDLFQPLAPGPLLPPTASSLGGPSCLPGAPSAPSLPPGGESAIPTSPGSPQETSAQPQDMSAQPQAPSQGGAGFGGESANLGGFYQGNVMSAGSGITSGAGILHAGSPATGINFPQVPLVLPGLLTAANSEFALPIDRVFFNYAYLNGFQVVRSQLNPVGTATGVPLGSVTRQAGFNLNLLYLGLEKTLLDGRASIYVRVPYLLATDNTSNVPIDGTGDITGGFKFVLWGNKQTGSVLTSGLDVSAPTARKAVFPALSVANVNTSNADVLAFAPTQTVTVNPTYIQPWLAGLLHVDRLFLHEFLGAVVPTDNRVSTFINNDFTLGYQIYRSESGLLRSLTPTLDVQALMPINHQGTPTASTIAPLPPGFPAAYPSPSFGFPTQVFLSSGVLVGVGQRTYLSGGVVTPVAGPRAYQVGATFGLNILY